MESLIYFKKNNRSTPEMHTPLSVRRLLYFRPFPVLFPQMPGMQQVIKKHMVLLYIVWKVKCRDW